MALKFQTSALIGIVLFAPFILAGSAAIPANSDSANFNKRLHGKYFSHEMATCLTSEKGFGPPPQLAALGKVHSSTSTAETVVSYDGNGGFTVEGNALSLAPDNVPPPNSTVTYPIVKARVSCEGKYQVNADNTLSIEATCHGNTTSGVLPGLAYTGGVVHETGFIQKGKVILVSGINGNVERSSTAYGSNTQICARYSTVEKIGDGDGE